MKHQFFTLTFLIISVFAEGEEIQSTNFHICLAYILNKEVKTFHLYQLITLLSKAFDFYES